MRTAFPNNPKLGYFSQGQLVEHATRQNYTGDEAVDTWETLLSIEVPADNAHLHALGQFAVQKDEILLNADAMNQLLALPATKNLDPVQHEIILDFILDREEFLGVE